MSGSLAIDAAAWQSPWRRRSVAEKSVLSVGLVVAALVLPVWPASVLVTAVSVVVLLGPARLRPGLLARSLRAPLLFIAIGAASVAVSVSWAGGPVVAITDASRDAAVSVAAHGVAGTLAVFVLAATTPMVDLLAGMRRARVPEACVDVAGLMYRLVFVLLSTVRQIREAQIARLGYRDRRTGLRSASALCATLLVRSWDRARRLEEGLAGRGYTGSLPTLGMPPRVSIRFLVGAVAVLVGVCAASVWLGSMAPGWRS